jgi:hypothetical protein
LFFIIFIFMSFKRRQSATRCGNLLTPQNGKHSPVGLAKSLPSHQANAGDQKQGHRLTRVTISNRLQRRIFKVNASMAARRCPLYSLFRQRAAAPLCSLFT